MSERKQEARMAPQWVSEAAQQITDEFCGGSDVAEDRIAATILSELWDAELAARQANQPQGKAQPDSAPSQQAHQLALDTIDRLQDERDTAFQRGQQAGLEKAAQIARKPRILDAMAGVVAVPPFGEEIAGEIERSLASAEPPNLTKPKGGNT